MDLANLKQLLQALDLTQTHLESKQTFDKYAKDGKLDMDCFMRMVKDLTAKAGTISLEVTSLNELISFFLCYDERLNAPSDPRNMRRNKL